VAYFVCIDNRSVEADAQPEPATEQIGCYGTSLEGKQYYLQLYDYFVTIC